jgi:hypothetical protein
MLTNFNLFSRIKLKYQLFYETFLTSPCHQLFCLYKIIVEKYFLKKGVQKCKMKLLRETEAKEEA